jgi:uroporphyrinogen decarboxylase
MISSTLKNDLLLKALRKELVPRPPVWMMRQAGRYMPEYQVLKKKYDFFTRVQTPELACEITLQPVDAIGVDAAILFSDILVIPQAMGMEVLMEEGHGPLLPSVITNEKDIAHLTENVTEQLDYVFKAIALTKKELNGRIPLIGFAGAPFTLLCYMVEGKGSKGFEKAKAFCFTNPALAHSLLTKITNATVAYLKAQVHAGVDVVQVFDSWSGLLGPADFQQFSAPYLLKIAEDLAFDVPVILFPKGSHYALQSLATQPAVSGIGLDWSLSPSQARLLAPADQVTLQGNFDPSKLLLPPSEIKKAVTHMIDEFGTQSYIANLGHGILPNVPVDHARAFVDAVKEYAYEPA